MTTTTLDPKPPTRGRPRAFDLDAALDRALEVFSERGYQAASISDLTEAMGLTSGSVYKAFKDKRGVFLASFERYRTVRRVLLDARLKNAGTGRDKIRELLAFYADASHGLSGKRGCLVVSSANDLALFDEEAANQIKTAAAINEARILDLLRLGQTDGSISPSVDAESCARTLFCLTQGMRIAGKTGRGQEEMAAVVDNAMQLVT
ncbi:TetR/AcrR family transcriptional regulator [Rhizobium metallidurans]|uniref:AcrR family transcriptional regulator n=1 Tax=Rhizobium metallidurans TaxID=1265931 RepID=A0A7W6CLS7_9HYPH|nr:TetR/AcrR family transcriptional regulator [Rhizobium metallidurans]MBB3963328.1 AcrR family transcriptional regulator [Rhizobium metallidurans]